MRKIFTRKRRGGHHPLWRYPAYTANTLVFLSCPTLVCAQVTGDASAKVQYEDNSNVFNQQNSYFQQPGNNNARRSDSYISEGAAFGLHDVLGRQELYLNASGTQYHYDRITELDHTDYKFDGGMLWSLTKALTGKLDVSRTRTMTSFLDTSISALSLQTEQKESAEASLRIAPEWKLDGTGFTHTVQQTQPNLPDLRLSEQSGNIALKYLGFGNFTSGIDAGYLRGRYTGDLIDLQPSYSQTTFDVLGTYKASGRSSFSGTLGYTDRKSASGVNSTSGITGDLNFQDQLTPKTAVSVDIGRAINSYVTNASSEIDTSAQASATWRATYKLEVRVAYTYTYRNFPDRTPIGYTVGTATVDIQQYAGLDLTYRPRRWLEVKLYGNRLMRHSNSVLDEFDASIYGLSFEVKTPKPAGHP